MRSRLFPKWVINTFFILGLISAFCFRLLVFFNYYFQEYGRVVWYIGILGYIFFFGFRFYISIKRRRTISEHNLQKVIEDSDIPGERKADLIYLVNSISKSKEVFNYIFIFILSGIAIVLDLVLKAISSLPG